MHVRRDVLLLIGIISAFLAGGGVLIASRMLPEDYAREFHPLSAGNLTLDSEIIVVREPTPEDDTYIYAINSAAKQALYIALNDTRVQQIIDEAKGKTVTIAALQPTVLVTSSGAPIHGSGGQVIVTANSQIIDGRTYSGTADFKSLHGKHGESHQQVWNVLVNMDREQVTSISESRRLNEETLQQNLVYTEMNMFMPDAVMVDTGTTIRWFNESNVPHNVVGAYTTDSGSKFIDSGFIERGRSWQQGFDEEGVFEYLCTIHTEDGMKGTIYVGG